MLSVAHRRARLQYALIRIGLRNSGLTYCSLTNHGFVFSILIEESVFGIVMDIVLKRIMSNLFGRL